MRLIKNRNRHSKSKKFADNVSFAFVDIQTRWDNKKLTEIGGTMWNKITIQDQAKVTRQEKNITHSTSRYWTFSSYFINNFYVSFAFFAGKLCLILFTIMNETASFHPALFFSILNKIPPCTLIQTAQLFIFWHFKLARLFGSAHLFGTLEYISVRYDGKLCLNGYWLWLTWALCVCTSWGQCPWWHQWYRLNFRHMWQPWMSF